MLDRVRTFWKCFVSGFRLGRAELEQQDAESNLARACQRLHDANNTLINIQTAHVQLLMDVGMSYDEATRTL